MVLTAELRSKAHHFDPLLWMSYTVSVMGGQCGTWTCMKTYILIVELAVYVKLALL